MMVRNGPHQPTQILGSLISLSVSNVVQATGTVMSIRWVGLGGVFAGNFCSAQGWYWFRPLCPFTYDDAAGIKQAGNVGNALWSLVISVHLFNQLFLRHTVE